jgi:hypothetical protein
MAAKPTKLELAQALAERNAQLEAARLRIAELEGDKAALQSKLEAFKQLSTKRSAKQNASAPKRVYEFDPAVPGDFVRASNEAKKNGGTVRRQTGALR